MIGFLRTLCVLTIFCMSWQTCLLAQDADMNNVHTRRYLEDIEYQQRTDQIEALIYRSKLNGMDGETLSGRGILTIPVVVHIMHHPEDLTPDNSSSNITDDRVIQAIADLNDLFANNSVFAPSPSQTNAGISSVDTEIQFCLAEFDPNGNPTTGITRTPTELTDLKRDDFCPGQTIKQDDCLKALDFWDSNDYMNIWVVNSICTSAINQNAECDLTGYSYLSGAHGKPYDGPVVISGIMGGTSENSAFLAHEVGHYFNLLDTFNDPPGPKPPCVNNNCLLDGDKVCDTPPDADPANASCFANQRVNSCTTDANDTSANNPFSSDVQDMYENYMDMAESGCRNTFTPGQKDRMRITLLGVRSSLLSSNGCDLSTTNATLLSVENPRNLSCLANLTPKVLVANTGSNVIGSISFSVSLNNVSLASFSWTGNLGEGDSLEINLNPISPLVGRNRLQIQIDQVNGGPDQDERDNILLKNFIHAGYGKLVQDFPYRMDFEDPTLIEDWLPGDLDGIIGFDTYDASVCSAAGVNSLRYNTNGSWNNGNGPVAAVGGTRDYFIGPQFDLTEYNTASLSFDVAFKESWSDKDLTLRVWAIDDCDNSYQLMYRKRQQELQSSTTPYDPFIPAWTPDACTEWRNDRISLDNFMGRVIRIVFEVQLEGQYSQNFYLDNITLEAEKFCIIPETVPDEVGTYVASHACTDDEGWMHFIKKVDASPQTPTDLLLLSLKDPLSHGVELIPEQVKVIIGPDHGNGAFDLSSAPYVENMYGWYVGNRFFQIDTKYVPDSSILLRTYYTQKDFEDLNIVLEDSMKMEGDRHLAMFSLVQGFDPNPSDGHSSISKDDFRDFRRGELDEEGKWSWIDHGGYRSATYAVNQLGAGGIGSGGEGKGYGAQYPVPFEDFSYTQSLGSVKLNWTTKRERNLEIFEIYRSGPGGEFEKLAEETSTAESETETLYSYIDIPQNSEPVKYFIRAKHKDGLEIDSDILSVDLNRSEFVKLFPNPTQGQMGIEVVAQENDKVEFIVLNASWQRLYHVAWPYNGTNPTLDISHLPPGIYFYDVLIREERYMGKIVLMPGK